MQRLTGVTVEGVNEPSYKLIDKMAAIYDSGVLKYVAWEDCTSRDQEILGDTGRPSQSREFVTDGKGYLKASVGTVDVFADASSPLHVKDALTRRGLAAELGGLMTFEAHEKIVRFLFKHFNKAPPDSRYAPITLAQVRQCDRAIFVELSERTRDGLRRGVDGVLPIDKEIDDVLKSFDIVALVTPLPQVPASNKRERPQDDQDAGKPGKAGSRAARRKENRAAAQEAALQKLRDEINTLRSANKGDNNKGKAQGKGKGNVPRELLGKTTVTSDGVPICFNYNLNGCSDARPGERCRRGLHVCAEPGCQSRSHGLRGHPGAAASSRG